MSSSLKNLAAMVRWLLPPLKTYIKLIFFLYAVRINPKFAVMCFTWTVSFDTDKAGKIISHGRVHTADGCVGQGESQVYLVSLWVRDLHGASLPNG